MTHGHHIALIAPSGDLTVRTAPALQRTLDGMVDKGCKRIVLSMADVSYVDSAGMGVLFCALRRMRANGGLISLTNVSPDVLRTLKIARLVDLIPVSTKREVAAVPELDPSVQPLWRTTIPVDGNDLHAARVRVEALASRMPFGRDAVFDLTLAVGEALGNAADHTSGEGILATVSAYSDRMVVEVSDCGEGIGLSEAIQKGECEGDERGRGIRLMQLLVDAVSIESRTSGAGTVVRMVKMLRTA